MTQELYQWTEIMMMSRWHRITADFSRPTALTVRHAGRPSGKHFLAVSLAATVLLLASSDLYAQGRVFHESFEQNHTNQWAQEYSKCITVEAAADGLRGPRGGKFMAKCNWNGLVDWTSNDNRSGLLLRSWSYNKEFFVRFWIRLDQNVDRKSGAKAFRMAGSYPIHSMFTQYYWTDNETFFHWTSVGEPGLQGPLTYRGGNLSDNQWHKFEIYHRNNTPGQQDGVIRMWYDGALRIDYTGRTSADDGTKWGDFTLMSNWSNNPGWEHDALNNVYWDDIEIYSDLGTGASGSMSAGTISSSSTSSSPAPPTAVRVIRSPDPQ